MDFLTQFKKNAQNQQYIMASSMQKLPIKQFRACKNSKLCKNKYTKVKFWNMPSKAVHKSN